MSVKARDIPLPRKLADGSFDSRDFESWMRNVYGKFSSINNFVNDVLNAGDGITLTFDDTNNTLEVKTTVSLPASTATGDIIYANDTPAWDVLTGNTSGTLKYLAQTGDGSNSAAPEWVEIASSTLPTMSSATLRGLITDETGSGLAVFNTSPTLVTPILGVAAATSINKLTITAPATGSTLTIADGKTLTANNTLILSGTDGETLTLTKGLTVTTNAGTLAFNAAGKTLTIELDSLVNQDLTTDSSPTFATVKLSGLTDGKIPYHVDDATGLADSPLY
ncbi:MAG: hypothetical protein WC332_10450, partial [Clostridia bacterium]